MKFFKKLSITNILMASFLMLLTACSPKVTGSEPAAKVEAPTSLAGTYQGTVEAYAGDLAVSVELDDQGKILALTVGDHQETEGIGDIPIEKLPPLILDSQSLDVDTISGATVTSQAILDATAKALESAGLDLATYHYIAKVAPTSTLDYTIDKSTLPTKKEITGSVTIKDAKGREVVLDLPISSYGISTMDVIDYIIPLKGEDAFHMLVGSGQDGGHGFNKYAELYVPLVGNYISHTGQISDHNAPFDLEMILSMQPDVLIINSAMGAHKYALEVEDQLTQAGIPIVLIDVPGKKLETSVQNTMAILGQIFQEEEKAAEVSAFIDAQYETILSKNLAAREDKPTVYYEKSGYSDIFGPTSTSKGGWGLVVDIAGGNNIADPLLLASAAEKGGASTIDPEYVLNADPDHIVVSGINDGWLDCLNESKDVTFDIVNRNGWSNLQAIQNNNLHEFAHSTSRSIFAFYPSLKMAKIFYPEEFADLNPEAQLDEFFDRFMLLDSDISTWANNLEDGK